MCIDEHRKAVARKRDGEHVPVNHHDHADEAATMLRSSLAPPEDQVAGAELAAILRVAFKRLGDRCRELLRLRYMEELSFKEIVPLLGGGEKTLAVQAGRCLDELKAIYDRGQRDGWRS